MVGFLRFLGIISVFGSFLGLAYLSQINVGYGVMRINPFIIASFIGSGLVSLGLFWGLADVIENLQQINKKLDKKDDHGRKER
jgi:hypothetical protein